MGTLEKQQDTPMPDPGLPVWKRAFDITGAVALAFLLSPFLLMVIVLMTIKRDFPYFYISERMKTVDQPFMLIKFRTMRPPRSDDENTGVSGGDKSDRITEMGRFLRRFRLDETPQLWNVLRGDMSFVGPRPPLRRYTESHRDLYRDVLACRPGLTGLATLAFHRHEERLLSNSSTSAETEEIYVRRCIPRKAAIDLIYAKNRSIGLDIRVVFLTIKKVLNRRR